MAVINTSGFQVQARPGIEYVDPRLMAPAYSNIIPAARSGFEFGESVRMAPLRQQLADIQLQEAENRLAMSPLEQQLAALRLGEMQQQAAIPEFVTEGVDIVGGDRRLAAVDINAPFESFEIAEDFAPKERVVRGQRVLAGGGVEPFERRETLATPADLRRQAASDKLAAQAEQRLAANQESLSAYRTAQAEIAALRAENDRIKANAAMQRAETLENNPSYGFVDVKRADGKTYRQYFIKSDPTRIVHEVDRGEQSSSIFMPGGTVTVSGGGDALRNLAGKYGATGAAPASSGPVAVRTKAERDALPSGTEYIGPDGKKYIKR